MTYEEIYHEYRRMKAVSEIRGMLASYCFEHNCAVPMRYHSHWSKREDIRHEMPWGNTTGHENLEYNTPWHDKIRHPDDFVGFDQHGELFLHMLTTPVIEVADDLQTARAVFLSPGFEGRAGEKMGTWAWSKYAYELLYEEGEWRVWHCRIFPVFRNDFRDDFGSCAEDDLCQTEDERFADFNAFFSYGPEVVMPRCEPEPPVPYSTWEPGWNFGSSEKEEASNG